MKIKKLLSNFFIFTLSFNIYTLHITQKNEAIKTKKTNKTKKFHFNIVVKNQRFL